MSCKILPPKCTDGNQTRSPSGSVSIDDSAGSFRQSHAPPVASSLQVENRYDYTVSPSVHGPSVYDCPFEVNRKTKEHNYPSAFTEFANTIRSKPQPRQSRTPPPAPSQPPFGSLQTIGTLQRRNGINGNVAPIEIDVNCIVNKGFFQSEGEWTCYRRNYFSSTCSYALPTLDMDEPGVQQYIRPGSHQPLRVHGFAMKISAEDADDDQHIIELVQHTPKRDKGPVMKPKPVQLWPESHLRHQEQTPTEHTFERLQFTHSTANNGRRRSPQQYFRLVVVLLADVGVQQDGGGLIKIAQRQSAKLVVRGRSPDHYQDGVKGSIGSGSDYVVEDPLPIPPGYDSIWEMMETGTRQATRQWRNFGNQPMISQPQLLEKDVVDADPGSSESSDTGSATEGTLASEEADTWSLWMQEEKQMALNAVMKSFCAWLDSKLASIQSAATNQDAEGNSRASSSSTSGQLVTEGNHTGGAQDMSHQRKLKRKKTDADEDGDYSERPGPNSKFSEIEPGEDPRRFACPYFKRDPRKYCREANCMGPGWVEVHRVKGHLYRRHALPPQCPRCWQDFKSESLRDIHLQNDPPCQRRENDTILDGFTKDQEKQLRSRKKSEKNVTAEGKWREMYQILFPDDDPATIPEPYYETVNVESGAPGPNTPADFAAFARREYPRFVRRELEVLFESEFQDVEERVRPRVQDIVLNLQPRLIALYERSALSARDDGEWAGLTLPDESVSDLRGEIELEETQPVELPPVPSPNPQTNTGFAEGEVSTSWVSDNSSEPTAFEVDIDWSFLPEDMFTYPLAGQFSLPQQDMSHLDDLQVAAQRQPTIGT